MAWIIKRILTSILLVWIVASLVFLAIRLVPGDPAELMLSSGGITDARAIEELRGKLGLDRPVVDQYLDSFTRFLQGDLGRSLRDGTPVTQQVMTRLPRTLELIGLSALVAMLIGLPAGIHAGLHPRSILSRALLAASSLSMALPVFVTGAGLILLFSQTLRWIPAGGYIAFDRNPMQHLVIMIMPSLALGLGLAAILFRITRTSVLEVASKDYVQTAVAKGVRHQLIVVRHILRNAMIPIVTVFGLSLGSLLGGTVLVEHVFNYPGLSTYLIDAVNARDYPEVIGSILVISILFVGLNLVIDIIYGLLDPRARKS